MLKKETVINRRHFHYGALPPEWIRRILNFIDKENCPEITLNMVDNDDIWAIFFKATSIFPWTRLTVGLGAYVPGKRRYLEDIMSNMEAYYDLQCEKDEKPLD